MTSEQLPMRLGYAQNIPLLADPEPTIMASRVNQALCDEMERGRVHGCGSIEGGYWVSPTRRTRINLHTGFPPATPQVLCGGPLNAYPLGDPLIESYMAVEPGNNCWWQQTPFIYLTASLGGRCPGDVVNELGVSVREYQQAEVLAEKFHLNGRWGAPNRLKKPSNWHENFSSLTFIGDQGLTRWVFDADGREQYVVECFNTHDGMLVLPACYLNRAGFGGPRRVFFPPEENIAVWYQRGVDHSVRDVLLSANPHFVLNAPLAPAAAAGCLPGGAASVAKTDMSTLRNRRVWLVFNYLDSLDVAAAVAMAARLRHEYINPEIVFHHGSTADMRHVGLKELCDAAGMSGIFIPEELRSDYLGDLTETAKEYHPQVLVENLICAGETTSVKVLNMPPLEAARRLAKFFCGTGNMAIFTGSEPLAKLKDLPGKKLRCNFLRRAPEERLTLFNRLTEGVKIVIIASGEFLTKYTDSCCEVLRSCAGRQIGVVLVARDPLPERLADMVSRDLTMTDEDRRGNSSVLAEGDDAWRMIPDAARLQKLTEDEKKQYCPATQPSLYVPRREAARLETAMS